MLDQEESQSGLHSPYFNIGPSILNSRIISNCSNPLKKHTNVIVRNMSTTRPGPTSDLPSWTVSNVCGHILTGKAYSVIWNVWNYIEDMFANDLS